MTPDSQENHNGAVVAFTNVKIGFEEGDVLRGVSFEVMPRETLVLLGETGTVQNKPLSRPGLKSCT